MSLIKGFFTLCLISAKALGSFQVKAYLFQGDMARIQAQTFKQQTTASLGENWLLMSVIHRAGKPESVLCNDCKKGLRGC